MADAYADFIAGKLQLPAGDGFAPHWTPDFLYDHQRYLMEWTLREGCAADLIDCGLGKSPIQLAVGQNVVEQTNRSALLAAPLAVSHQTMREAEKFDIPAIRSADGRLPDRPQVVITNFQRLHHFDASAVGGILIDEASILRNVVGRTRRLIQRMMNKVRYRSLYSGTAAPNAFHEFGTFSEALGRLRDDEIKEMFFRQVDGPTIARWSKGQRHSGRSDMHHRGWRFRGHAEEPFWRYVASWSRSARLPSDLGPEFQAEDRRYNLPPIDYWQHLIEHHGPKIDEDGQRLLITPLARGMGEQRAERRSTLVDRATKAAELVDHGDQAIIWCELNPEGKLLAKTIPGAVEVAGSAVRCGSDVLWRPPAGASIDDQKEEAIMAFERGDYRVLITKPRIGAWGLNLQNCHRMVFFGAMNSFESWYQAVRRCWRFGQKHPVTVDLITTAGEARVLANLLEKQKRFDYMFQKLVSHMNAAESIVRDNIYIQTMELPRCLSLAN